MLLLQTPVHPCNMDVIARIDAAVGAAFDNLLTYLLRPPVLPAGARPADAALVQEEVALESTE